MFVLVVLCGFMLLLFWWCDWVFVFGIVYWLYVCCENVVGLLVGVLVWLGDEIIGMVIDLILYGGGVFII